MRALRLTAFGLVILTCLNASGHADELRSIGFGANSASWAVITKSKYTYRRVSTSAANRVEKIVSDGGRLRGIGFTPNGGWAICYNKRNRNYWTARGIPDDALSYLEKRSSENAEILDFAFGPKNSWIILSRKGRRYTLRYSGIPDDLVKYLNALSTRSAVPQGIGLTLKGGRVVVYKAKKRGYSYRYRNIPEQAVKYLQNLE